MKRKGSIQSNARSKPRSRTGDVGADLKEYAMSRSPLITTASKNAFSTTFTYPGNQTKSSYGIFTVHTLCRHYEKPITMTKSILSGLITTAKYGSLVMLSGFILSSVRDVSDAATKYDSLMNYAKIAVAPVVMIPKIVKMLTRYNDDDDICLNLLKNLCKLQKCKNFETIKTVNTLFTTYSNCVTSSRYNRYFTLPEKICDLYREAKDDNDKIFNLQNIWMDILTTMIRTECEIGLVTLLAFQKNDDINSHFSRWLSKFVLGVLYDMSDDSKYESALTHLLIFFLVYKEDESIKELFGAILKPERTEFYSRHDEIMHDVIKKVQKDTNSETNDLWSEYLKLV
jgi:hypothetical protein